MIKRIEIGSVFGRLTVIAYSGRYKNGMKVWKCRCECGGVTLVSVSHLNSGHTKSCGCFRRQLNRIRWLKHGQARRGGHTRAYSAWIALRTRCNNENGASYVDYGGRGIGVCRRWSGPNGFKNFYEDMGDPPPGTSLERKKNNKGYSPSNCVWDYDEPQCNNRRSNKFIRVNGKKMTLARAERVLGFRRGVLSARLLRGMSDEDAIKPYQLRAQKITA